MTIELKKNMKIIDSIGLKTGIRHFRFDPNEGFFLNQKRIFIKGMCMHHDAGPFGVAVPDQLLAHRLQQLKEMGCNAIRTSHNPFSPEFYDLCDQMGFLVLDEFFDGWHGKADSDYGARFFHDDWKQDVRDTIIRDRNHVCIFMWSIGNETGKNDKYGISDIVHDLDHCGRKYQASAWKPAAIRLTTGGDVINGVDVEGFNAHCEIPGWLEKHRQQAPEKCVILTEAPHVLQTRGHYRTQTDYWNGVKDAQHIPDLSEEGEIFTNDDGPSYSSLITYHSSYDNSIFYNNHQGVLKIVQDNTYIMGQFAWTAFDYLGESFGWPFRMSDAGIIDLCGFPKDAYYLYKSQWTETAVLHLLPHWTFPGIDGKIINVVAYTNCEEVELFLNGKSIGMKKREIADMTLQWNVPYTQGILRAVGIKNGREISFEHRTAGASKGLNVECINLSKGLLKFDFSAVDSRCSGT
jgi:beta-galactosidase